MASRTPSTARRATSPRPIARLDRAGFDPTGPFDPLAVVASAWPDSVRVDDEAEAAPVGGLGELADRAGVQVAALRGALDQAARVERALGARSSELAQRLDQASRFEREMDQRLAAAGRSVGVLDQAGAALGGLERVVAELRGAGADVEAGFRCELEAERARMELLLSEQREAFAARVAEISDQAARAVASAWGAAAEAEVEARRIRETMERSIRGEADCLAAALDRQAAQVQARVAIVMDDAAQRVMDLERTGERVAATAEARLEKACEHAASVLGHDPRQAWMGAVPVSAPAPNSLADFTVRAEAAARSGDETVVRLSLATERASEIEAKVVAAVENAGALKTAERLLEETGAAEARLGVLRDDLESAASSVRHNLSQAQRAEVILGKTVDRARDKAHSLDRSMDQVTEQASNMAQVARDVAGLVLRAEQAREALVSATDRVDERDAPPARTAGRLRRAPFGPPSPHEDEGGERSAAA